MKKSISFVYFVLFGAFLFAQTPQDIALKLKQKKQQQANITLGIQNACLDVSQTTVQLNPAPTACGLEPNTTYTWCVTVNKYNQPSANWVSAFIPVLGCAWDSTTIQPVGQLASAGSTGSWIWTHGVTGQQTGNFSPNWGWYFDRDNDGNPGNNYGDNATCCWSFCFTVKTINLATAPTQRPECLSVYNSGNADINGAVKIKVLSDEQIGSWAGSGACFGDGPAPTTGCSPTLNLCPTLSVDKSNAKCSAPNGTAWIKYPSSVHNKNLFSFLWFSNPPQTGDTAQDLFPGTYQIIGSSSTGCNYNFSVVIADNNFSVKDSSAKTVCFGDSTGKAWVELPTVGGPFGVKWLASTRINDTLYKQPAGEYLYTVTDSSTGCQITDTVTIYSPEVINGFFKVDTSKCLLNNGKILADISGGTGNYQLTWATNQGIPLNPINSKNPDNLSGGNYILTVVDAHNCIKKFTIEVPYTTPPTAQYLPASTEELVTDSIYAITDNSLSGTGTLTNWWWEIEGNTNNPIQTQNIDKYFFPDSGSYKIKLIVKNSAGCYDTISNIHKVKKHFFELYFPNIITPNGDGKNDMLTIKNLTQYPENQLLIYNRWGKKVFEKNNYQNDWDAKGMEDGTYYYIVKVPKQKDYEGFVSVIR